MIKEIKHIDRIEVINNSMIQVRECIIIERDGVEIAKSYHRSSFAPGSNISEMPQSVQGIAALVWTQEVVAEYQAKMAEVI